MNSNLGDVVTVKCGVQQCFYCVFETNNDLFCRQNINLDLQDMK